MESIELAQNILKILDDAGADEIVAFDVRGRSSINDITVLCTGKSTPHLRAIVSAVRASLREKNIPCYRDVGEPASGWVVIDYVNVIIHAFIPEARAYYDLDEMWKDAPIVTC